MRDEASRAFTLKIDIDYAVSNALKNTQEKYITNYRLKSPSGA
jgi:hypothetical protein